jgi:hypothetical protein
MAEGPFQKTSYFLSFCVLRLIVPDAKDRASLAVPAKLSFVYYLLRPIRLIKEYGFGPVWEFLRLLPRLFGRN